MDNEGTQLPVFSEEVMQEINDSIKLSEKEVNLEELKNQVLKEVEPAGSQMKVEFFRSYGRGQDCLAELKKQINDFLEKHDSYSIVDIKFQVVKNFLLGSTLGEYEENGYGMVSYIEVK